MPLLSKGAPAEIKMVHFFQVQVPVGGKVLDAHCQSCLFDSPGIWAWLTISLSLNATPGLTLPVELFCLRRVCVYVAISFIIR